MCRVVKEEENGQVQNDFSHKLGLDIQQCGNNDQNATRELIHTPKCIRVEVKRCWSHWERNSSTLVIELCAEETIINNSINHRTSINKKLYSKEVTRHLLNV